MNLAVDIGNTLIKVGLFEGNDLKEVKQFENLESLRQSDLKGDFWVYSSVKGHAIKKSTSAPVLLQVTNTTRLPIKLRYETPETLGVDRFTAAVGAHEKFPNQNVLIIDYGTCITYDLLTENGEFQGGVISPGLKMRQMAMHQHTHQLPDITNSWQDFSNSLPGKSTGQCLYHGSVTGILMESNGFIEHFKKDYENLAVIITGGDSGYFESKLKATIFADSNLVLKGLNKILTHNKLDD
jgi:type III pantothenate kinase